MKIGAVDIGSNAVRFQVSNVLEQSSSVTFKKIEYVRYALRLGEDVFKHQIIGSAKEEKLQKLIKAFGLLFEVYEVDCFKICATSAMRESKNGKDISERIYAATGFQIEMIDGEKEAELINSVIFNNLDSWNYLHIDVGGGSTELNVYTNRKKIASKSFHLGSVRSLHNGINHSDVEEMNDWIRQHVTNRFGSLVAIGTGGNIGKLNEMAKGKTSEPMSLQKLKQTRDYIEKFSLEERINTLLMNPDRADVIIPAAEIYINAMESAGALQIMVPDVGLKDGIIYQLYQENMPS